MATNATNSTSSGNSTFIGTLFGAPPADVQAQAGIQWKVQYLRSRFAAFMVLLEIELMCSGLFAGQKSLVTPFVQPLAHPVLELLTGILIGILTLLHAYRNNILQLINCLRLEILTVILARHLYSTSQSA